MYPKKDSSIVMIWKDTKEINEENLDSLFQGYLKKSRKGSNFIFDDISGIHI